PLSVETFKNWLALESPFKPVVCKESTAAKNPFRRMKIDRRDEIVTFGHKTASPEAIEASMLSPEDWHARLATGESPVVVDVRNRYEIALGKFRGAIDPGTDVFTDFPEFVRNSALPKDRDVLMYCTGGIRCEKALGFMLSEGYRVRQLAGGIL